MTAATNVVVNRTCDQFRGLFSEFWDVRFTLDTGAINSNATAEDTVAIPGVLKSDGVIFFTREGTDIPHGINVIAHVGASGELHITSHNSSGGSVNPDSSTYHVIIARPVR